MLLALTRGLFVAGLLSGFGAAVFAAFAVQGAARALTARQSRAIVKASLGLALVAGLVWLALQTSIMAETDSVAATAAQIPTVLFGTRFGQVLLLQAVAGAAAFILVRRGDALVAALLGVAALLEAGHSHAFAMGDGLLTVSQAVHLLAAGAWLGGLAPLLAVVREATLADAQRTLRRFSPLALACVMALCATALFQGVVLSGGWSGLTGTDYGTVVLLKAALFLVLIALAANNRLRLTPALAGPGGEDNRRALALSIGIETAIGLLIVLAAAALSGLEPGMHMTSA